MAASHQSNSPWRSIAAVMIGFVGMVVAIVGTDAALHAAGIYPPWQQPMADHLWAIALLYRAVFIENEMVITRHGPV